MDGCAPSGARAGAVDEVNRGFLHHGVHARPRARTAADIQAVLAWLDKGVERLLQNGVAKLVLQRA